MNKLMLISLVLFASTNSFAKVKSEEIRLKQCISEVEEKIHKTGQVSGYGTVGVLGGLIVTEENYDAKGVKTYTLGGGPLARSDEGGYIFGAYAGAVVQLDEESCVILDYSFEPGCLEATSKNCLLSKED